MSDVRYPSSSLPSFNPPDDTTSLLGSSSAVSKTSASDITATEVSTSDSPEKMLKNSCKKLIQQNLSFGKLSTKIWTLLSENDNKLCKGLPKQHKPIETEIASFKKKYKNQITELRKTPWKKYISDLAQQLEKNPKSETLQKKWKEIEEFRNAAVQLQNKLTVVAASLTGINHNEDDWDSFGTVGNDSDIDYTFTPKRPMSQDDQMLIKIFSDTFYTYIFGEDCLSGLQLDLETYITHPGGARDSEGNISDKSKGKLYHLELTMAYLEMRNSYGDNIEKWNEYKEKCITSHKEPLKEILKGIFAEVEKFYNQIQIDILCTVLREHSGKDVDIDKIINEMTSDTEKGLVKLQRAAREAVKNKGKNFEKAYKQASLSYKYPRLLVISKQMDDAAQELSKLQNKGEQTPEDIDRIDELELKVAALGLIRNSFFPESYLTRGAYNIVCHNEGGQQSKTRNIKILEKLELNRFIDVNERKIISKELRPTATSPLEFVISAKENSAKFFHIAFPDSAHDTSSSHKTKADELKDKIKIAISSSKYAERVTSSSFETLKMMEKKLMESPEEYSSELLTTFKDTYEKALQLHEKASGLEKCKRQVEITDVTTKKLLKEKVKQICEDEYEKLKKLEKTPEELQKLEEDHKKRINFIDESSDVVMDNILAMFRPGGLYFNQEISPVDKYNLILSKIDDLILTPLKIPSLSGITKENLSQDTKIFSSVNTNVANMLKSKPDIQKLFNSLSLTDQQSLIIYAKKKAKHPNNPKELAEIVIKELNESLNTSLTISQKVKQKLTFGHASVIYKEVGDLHKTKPSRTISPEIRAARQNLWQKIATSVVLTTSGNPDIDAIIRAKSGMPRIGDHKVQELHTKSRELYTIEELGLTSVEEIDKYLESIETLSDTLLELTQATRLITTPMPEKDIMLTDLWNQTVTTSPDNEVGDSQKQITQITL